MNLNVTESTVRNNLCVSCGICKAVCPQNCIEFIKYDGQYIPQIKMNCCTKCGICSDICSAHKIDINKLYRINGQRYADDIYIGNYISCYNAFAKDESIRLNSASGGCITAIIKELLSREEYRCAFLVNDFNYEKFVETKPFYKNDSLDQTSKSRYIPISHENMVEYALMHSDERIIIVATGCVVHTFLNIINRFKLNRNNYLILGLFCGKTLNNNIFDYFKDYDIDNSELNLLIFRSKEQIGWPGNVKLEYSDGTVKFLPAKERMIIKDYFQLEGCLYCVDKLNQFADISFGDNYTGINGVKGDLGSNSIIIRTQLGKNAFNIVEQRLNIFNIDIKDVEKSQKINNRKENFQFAKILFAKSGVNLYPGLLNDNFISKKTISDYYTRINKITIGRTYPDTRQIILNNIIKEQKKHIHLGRIKQCLKILKKLLKGMIK